MSSQTVEIGTMKVFNAKPCTILIPTACSFVEPRASKYMFIASQRQIWVWCAHRIIHKEN
jgi:hypothetical protein